LDPLAAGLHVDPAPRPRGDIRACQWLGSAAARSRGRSRSTVCARSTKHALPTTSSRDLRLERTAFRSASEARLSMDSGVPLDCRRATDRRRPSSPPATRALTDVARLLTGMRGAGRGAG
jgi:hypothetical protein